LILSNITLRGLQFSQDGTVVDQNKIGQSVTLDSFTIQRYV
jgi:hypothetical protein